MPVATVIDARPAAIIDGRVLHWGQLRAALTELGGATALQEAVLQQVIDTELRQAGITIDESDIAAERRLLVETLDADPNTAVRLLDELRARRGLGPTRFQALLRRNAGLRALVRPQVAITDEAVFRMHDLAHGPKRQARIITVSDIDTARDITDELRAGRGFADLAVQRSTDVSASRGGLLEPISRDNPNYPEALKATLWSLTLGQWSDPILMQNQYAIVFLDRETLGDTSVADPDDAALRHLVRVNQERLLMDRLVRQLLDRTNVTVYDESLRQSWSQRGRAGY